MKKNSRVSELLNAIQDESKTIAVLCEKYEASFQLKKTLDIYRSISDLKLKSVYIEGELKRLIFAYEDLVAGMYVYLNEKYDKTKIPSGLLGLRFSESKFKEFQNFLLSQPSETDKSKFDTMDSIQFIYLSSSTVPKFFEHRKFLKGLIRVINAYDEYSKHKSLANMLDFAFDRRLIEEFCRLINNADEEKIYLDSIEDRFQKSVINADHTGSPSSRGTKNEEFLDSIRKMIQFRISVSKIDDSKIESKPGHSNHNSRNQGWNKEEEPKHKIQWIGNRKDLAKLFKLLEQESLVKERTINNLNSIIENCFDLKNMKVSRSKPSNNLKHLNKSQVEMSQIEWVGKISTIVRFMELLVNRKLIEIEPGKAVYNLIVDNFTVKEGQRIKRGTLSSCKYVDSTEYRHKYTLLRIIDKIRPSKTKE